MAGPALVAYGHQGYHGVPPAGRLGMVLSSPQHHFALSRRGQIHDDMRSQLAALGIDGDGLKLNIVRVRGP